MQCSESLGMKKDSLLPEESIKQGCAYFAKLLKAALDAECDVNTAVQAYNYGGKYVEYVAANGKVHTFELAENFAKEKSKGKKVPYNAAIAVQTNGGWRYHYGNMFYVYLVSQYLYVPEFTDETVTIIMTEALKYQGWNFYFGSPDGSWKDRSSFGNGGNSRAKSRKRWDFLRIAYTGYGKRTFSKTDEMGRTAVRKCKTWHTSGTRSGCVK